MPTRLRDRVSKPKLHLSKRSRLTAEQPISYLMHKAVASPELISLAAGLVDQQSLPVDETLATLSELLGDHEAGRAALQYGTTQGYVRLRELAVEHLERLEGHLAAEIGLDPANVVVTTGSQQLLQLVSDVLIDPGDIVLMGAPEYFVYMGTLTALGATIVGLPMDENGLIPDGVAETLQRLERARALDRVRLVYCGSYFQNPSGVTLSEDRRAAVLEIVQKFSSKHRILVLEDAAYRELCYEGRAPRSIRSLDSTGEWVILTQTFSKPYAPGIKVGYSVLPPDLLEPVLHQKGNHDFGSANFNQHMLAHLMESGRYAQHVEMLRRVYRDKLTALVQALEREFGRVRVPAQWTRPHGGLYVWLTLPEQVDTRRDGPLFRHCIENGVLYVPGEYCFPPDWNEHGAGSLGTPRSTMRLSFGVQPIDRIQEGVARLATAAAECMAES